MGVLNGDVAQAKRTEHGLGPNQSKHSQRFQHWFSFDVSAGRCRLYMLIISDQSQKGSLPSRLVSRLAHGMQHGVYKLNAQRQVLDLIYQGSETELKACRLASEVNDEAFATVQTLSSPASKWVSSAFRVGGWFDLHDPSYGTETADFACDPSIGCMYLHRA